MANKRKGGAKQPSSWRGSSSSPGPTNHRWQGKEAGSGASTKLTSNRWKWRIYFAATLALVAYFVFLLMNEKPRTSVIAFAVTNYDPGVPLNAWAPEDVDGFRQLSEIIDLRDISFDWQDPVDGKAAWENALEQATGRRQPLVVYVSMHGVVNDKGDPCLLPPSTSPLSAGSMIPVADLLDDLSKRVPEQRPKLLILDCHRVLVDWDMGIVYNTFAERLDALLKESQFPRLAVLCAASPGQQSWAAEELNGSAMGRFVQLGLAGMADGSNGTKKDKKVSLRELQHYLHAAIPAWTKANRGESQWVRLYPENAQDFRVSWSLQPKATEALLDQFRAAKPAKPSVPTDEIIALWQELSRLQAEQAADAQYQPVRWRSVEAGLVRLEQMAHAGPGHAEDAVKLKQTLERDLQKIQAVDDRLALNRPLHSLALNRYFRLMSDDQIQQAQTQLDRLANPRTKIEPDPNDVTARLESTAFLLAAREQEVSTLWRQTRIVENVYKLRQAAEALGVPNQGNWPGGDRAHYFVRDSLDYANPQRHRLEDAIFLGQDSADVDLAQLYAEVGRLHEWARKIQKQATSSVQTNDRCWARIPYLAAWTCRQLAGSLNTGSGRQSQSERVEKINELIDHARQLSQQIDQSPRQLDKYASLSIVRTAGAVQNELSDLEQTLDIGEYTVGPESAREIMARLELPPSDVAKRQELIKQSREIRQKLHREYLQSLSSTDAPVPVGDAPSNELLAHMLDWKHHPLVRLVEPQHETTDVTGADGVDQIDALTTLVRKRLYSLATSESSVDPARDTDRSAYRMTLAQAAQRFRAVASLAFSTAEGVDPIGDLRRFDLQELLLWHRQNVIDGTWHAPQLDRGTKPFFAIAADNAADAIKELGSEFVDAVLNAQDELMRNRRQAAIQPVADTVTSDVDTRLNMQVTHKSGEFSNGTAAVYVQNQGKRVRDLPFAGGIKVPFGDENSRRFESKVLDASSASSSLKAVVFYRGRKFESTFVVRKSDGVSVDFEPYAYDSPNITLIGDLVKQSSLVFVVDCSRSMNQGIPENRIEVVGQAARELPRIQVAKTHLTSMLNRLAEENRRVPYSQQTRVGVIFVGHRSTYEKLPPYKRLFVENWPNRISRRLIPAHDVEEILRLRRFDSAAANEVTQTFLPKVTPFGQSPLYLALIQAFRQFDDERIERKGVIAITDGENTQWISPGDQIFSTKGKSNLNEDTVLSRETVPVHLLDFNVNPNPGFRRIADETKGTYVSAKTSDDLLHELKKHIDLDGYFVFDEAGKLLNTERDDEGEVLPKRLNETLPVKLPRFREQEYQVKFRTVQKSVLLEGGEAIQLKAVDVGGAFDIQSIPYPTTRSVAGELIRGAQGRRANCRLSAHRTTRTNDDVQFTVSWQRTNTHFTRRPLEVWLQVTPLMSDSQGGSYVFYDVNYEPQKPVPELAWRATNWPRDAKQAKLRFWCKYEPTPAQHIVLSDVFRRPDQFREFEPVRGVNGVKRRMIVDPRQRMIRVVEQHLAGNHEPDNIYTLRVLFETELEVVPQRIARSYDNKASTVPRFATHNFYFSEQDWDTIRNSAADSRISLASRRDVQDGAIQLREEEELIVPIASEGNGLRVGRR